jgi:hypothetical protein
MRDGWGGKQSSVYSPSSSSSSERSDDDDKYFCVRFIRGWMLGVHLFSRLLGLFLLIASASRQLFLSSPAHARPAFRSPRQHNNLIHIFDPAQQQHTLHFRISRRVGVSPPYSNPPVNSSCAQDTHTHTQHIRTYLKSPSTE